MLEQGCALETRSERGDPIIPISGVEAYFRPDRSNKDTRKAWHLCLFAKNLKGWHSLLRITSEAYSSGFYQYPCVDWELLEAHSDGLICSTALYQRLALSPDQAR